jgi:hypothetical protein
MSYYKDFNKDVKDLLTKNYTDAGKWKVESKFKGSKDKLFINPQATNNGASVDVEYQTSCCPAKLKVNVNPALEATVTATYEDKGHKVEVSTNKDLAYEVSYELKYNQLRINEKLTQKAVDSGLAFSVAPHCQIGAGLGYGLKDGKVSWTAGVRYSDAGRLVSVVTNQLKTYTTGLLFPFKIADRKVTAAAQVDCGSKFTATVGLETGCIICPSSTVRARVNNEGKWAFAHISKLPDNWKAAITVDANLKPGLTLTRE